MLMAPPKKIFAFVGTSVPFYLIETLESSLRVLVKEGKEGVSRCESAHELGEDFQILTRTQDQEGLKQLQQNPHFQTLVIALTGSEALSKNTPSFLEADFCLVLRDREECNRALKRFVELLFGNPFLPPDLAEQAMMHASVARLASSDLSRQVGASLYSREGLLISTGYNEVPRAGGGFYTNDDSEKGDARDFRLCRNSSFDAKRDIYEQILSYLKNQRNLSIPEAFFDKVSLSEMLIELKEHTSFMDILEYSRNVHAEMSCLINALRRGQEVIGSTLYTTTFPCHKCAKHLVAAGVKKVFYLDGFEKSRAFDLFEDSLVSSLSETTDEKAGSKVVFTPFMGVTPKRYALFEAASRENERGEMTPWSPLWRL